ncbi:UreD-domain-containing protein [Choiromyces venosus 120613-1]|uniref:UreD-domain-containing protein n=1 Tax=Choiromyces venosus 120613-1 TaxID=1336337 RepID=A0A3N4JNU0_9PEZI|nr:UreD-domain-containing protein [Choiromyces venosus 120613-1]
MSKLPPTPPPLIPSKPPPLPGYGLIHARLLPPSHTTLPHLHFAYPLKLISIASTPSTTNSYQTVFQLTYGGGLVSNDQVNLRIVVETNAKLCLLTQGSTKIFKQKSDGHKTRQALDVRLCRGARLLLLPDPLQPFGESVFSQIQRFWLEEDGGMVVLDWVTEGRAARGERWDLESFESRNEVYCLDSGRLLLRDAILLKSVPSTDGDSNNTQKESLRSKMDGLVVFATLIIRGAAFERLATYAKNKFSKEPRIGGRNFDAGGDESGGEVGGVPVKTRRRRDVLWTVSEVRGFVLVKVSGWALEEVRGFLRELLIDGEDVVGEFGEDCLLCLR